MIRFDIRLIIKLALMYVVILRVKKVFRQMESK